MRLAIATAVGALLLGAPSPSVGQEAADPPCCQTIATSRELYNAFAAATDGVVNVCASATPIAWDETEKLDALGRIYLNNDNDSNPSVNPSVTSFQLLCVRDDEYDEKRCVVDFAPSAGYDPTTAYGGFVLQNQRQLVVDGFEFKGHRGQNEIFYNQDGSKLTIRNSAFTDNGSDAPSRKTGVIVRDLLAANGGVSTTIIENSLFYGNQGPLLTLHASNAILESNVFYDNGLPAGEEDTNTYNPFIDFQGYGGKQAIKLQGNHFVSFQALASSGAHDKLWMIAVGSASGQSLTKDELIANIGVASNCASSNDVAGTYAGYSINECNSGVYVKGSDARVCALFTGTCPTYSAASPPNKPLPSSFCASTRRYFLLDDDCKALDFDPDTSATLIDTTSPAAGLAAFGGEDYRSVNDITFTGTPPLFYSQGDLSDLNCRLPTSDEDPDATYPGQGCTCFLPDTAKVSYFDVADQSDDTNAATGYETAFDTSVTGGVSIAGWFKAGETSGQEGSGQQTSLIFSRGKKSSWKAGYTFGLDLWKGWRFQVILQGEYGRYTLSASSPVNSYPGDGVWHFVVGIYDAEKGRISLYVDNEHVATNYAPATFSRSATNIRWTQSCVGTDPPDCELDYTRIGNGYDANDKNFRGCTGGFRVYGKALQVTTQNPKVTTDEWKVAGNGVSFPSDTEVLLQSSGSPYGVLLTKYAFNGPDVDFMVEYTQEESGTGWQSKLAIFFVPAGTSPDSLLLANNGNEAGGFEAQVAGYLSSKVYTTIDTATYLNCGTATANCKDPDNPTVSPKYLELTLRLRRLGDFVYAYYKVPDGDTWVQAGQSMSLPEALRDVPIHFGLRVLRNYQADHHFSVMTTQLAGGPPLLVPTEGPTASPTERVGRDMTADEWLFTDNGHVSFPSNTEVLLQSTLDGPSQFGVVLSKKAYNGPDLDFQVEFTQTEFYAGDNAYESRLGVFFAPAGTYPDTLLQPDFYIDDFYPKTVGYLRSKVHGTIDATWFDSCYVDERGAGCCNQFIANKERTLERTLRLRRYGNFIEPYYKLPGKGWVGPLQLLEIPAHLENVPLQVGFRVEKDYKANHVIMVRPTLLAGGDPLDIPSAGSTLPISTGLGPQCPTNSPSESPTSNPTESPTKNPSASPTQNPTNSPTKSPSASPSASPTSSPTESPNLPAAPLTTTEVKVMHKYIVPKASSYCDGKPTCWVEGTASVEIVEGSTTLHGATLVQLSTPPGPFTPVTHGQCSGSCFAETMIEGLDASKEVVDGKARIMVFTKQLKNGSLVSSIGRTWQPGGKKKRALRSLVEGTTDEVTVYMPETFVVDDTGDGNQTTVPLVFTSSSDTDLEIDVCMYAPEGYQLDSVLDEAGNPIEEEPISCIHVLLASKDQTFLFEMTEFADVPASGRMLKRPPAERDVASLSVKVKGKEFTTKLKKGNGHQKKLAAAANLFG